MDSIKQCIYILQFDYKHQNVISLLILATTVPRIWFIVSGGVLNRVLAWRTHKTFVGKGISNEHAATEIYERNERMRRGQSPAVD